MRIIHTAEDWGWCGPEGWRRPHRNGVGETLRRRLRDGVVTVVTCGVCGTYLYTKVEGESK